MRPALVRSNFDRLVDRARAKGMRTELYARDGKLTVLRVSNKRGDAMTERVGRSLQKSAGRLLERMPA